MLQGTGIISADKLTRVVKIIVGQAISEELVPELMRGLDSDFDNQISFDEFKNLLQSTADEGDSETRCRRRARRLCKWLMKRRKNRNRPITFSGRISQPNEVTLPEKVCERMGFSTKNSGGFSFVYPGELHLLLATFCV